MRRAAILGCAALLVSVVPARADAIDGQWCLGHEPLRDQWAEDPHAGRQRHHRQLRPPRV